MKIILGTKQIRRTAIDTYKQTICRGCTVLTGSQRLKNKTKKSTCVRGHEDATRSKKKQILKYEGQLASLKPKQQSHLGVLLSRSARLALDLGAMFGLHLAPVVYRGAERSGGCGATPTMNPAASRRHGADPTPHHNTRCSRHRGRNTNCRLLHARERRPHHHPIRRRHASGSRVRDTGARGRAVCGCAGGTGGDIGAGIYIYFYSRLRRLGSSNRRNGCGNNVRRRRRRRSASHSRLLSHHFTKDGRSRAPSAPYFGLGRSVECLFVRPCFAPNPRMNATRIGEIRTRQVNPPEPIGSRLYLNPPTTVRYILSLLGIVVPHHTFCCL